MQSATTSGHGAKIASALDYVASKAPPGMPKWVAISKEGAEKAKKGDIDGAKASCKLRVRAQPGLAAMPVS
ncbi:hypothetical protein ACMHYB_52520 [Sorangium sp. So ce1128]